MNQVVIPWREWRVFFKSVREEILWYLSLTENEDEARGLRTLAGMMAAAESKARRFVDNEAFKDALMHLERSAEAAEECL